MASHFASFTITQPFLGAPLQFQPALGSKELEQLIDIFVIGSAAKQDKLSEVTIDFYSNATVDLNTGALTKTYNVFTSPFAPEQSPAGTQSSGFSPPMFTPSPGSSATFFDSAFGSVSMTPPTRNRGRRVLKPKKETKKVAESRLPGFSIMTKDGVDVTSSAGRGTKTKEQREHAHLMRIMKACDACKKKKIRCEPSHRQSRTDVPPTSKSTSKSASSRAAPTPRAPSMPAFSPSNAIEDFVLFPEDSTWNPDMAMSQDLGDFNFDIDIDLSMPPLSFDQSLDFNMYQQPQFQNPSSGRTPVLNDQYGLDQWTEPQGFDMAISYTRPHAAGASQDSGQLDANWTSPCFQADTDTSPGSSSLGDSYWSSHHNSIDHTPMSQNSSSDNSPQSSGSADWSTQDPGLVSMSSQCESPSSMAGPSMSRSSSEQYGHIQSLSSMGSVESLSRPTANEGQTVQHHSQVYSSGVGITVDHSDPSDPHPGEGATSGALHRPGHKYSPANGHHGPRPRGSLQSLADQQQQASGKSQLYSLGSLGERRLGHLSARPQVLSCPAPEQASSLANICQTISQSLCDSESPSYVALGNDLQRLQPSLAELQPRAGFLQDSVLAQIRNVTSHLQGLSSRIAHQRYNKLDPEYHLAYVRQCQVQARRLVRSLCATINSVSVPGNPTSNSIVNITNKIQVMTGKLYSNDCDLSSGRTLQFSPSIADADTHENDVQQLESGLKMWVESTMSYQISNGASSSLGKDSLSTVLKNRSGDGFTSTVSLDGLWAVAEHAQSSKCDASREISHSALTPKSPNLVSLEDSTATAISSLDVQGVKQRLVRKGVQPSEHIENFNHQEKPADGEHVVTNAVLNANTLQGEDALKSVSQLPGNNNLVVLQRSFKPAFIDMSSPSQLSPVVSDTVVTVDANVSFIGHAVPALLVIMGMMILCANFCQHTTQHRYAPVYMFLAAIPLGSLRKIDKLSASLAGLTLSSSPAPSRSSYPRRVVNASAARSSLALFGCLIPLGIAG